MSFRKRGFRAMVAGLVVATGLALTPAAFAGGHSHVSVGVSVPGVSIGYGSGYYGGYYGPSYYAAPAPVYYSSYYDPYYYAPAYYGPSVVYYSGGHRYYGHRHYYGHDRHDRHYYGNDRYHH